MRQSVTTGATAVVQPHPGIRPGLTEAVLCAQEGVHEACVSFQDGELSARVTVDAEAAWTPRELQRICMDELGLHQTPRRLLLVAGRPTENSIYCAA